MDLSSQPKMGLCIRGRAPASSISYHESGSHLFVASEADSVLRIVDCISGSSPSDRPSMLKVHREGIRTVKATHHGHCVLFAPGVSNGPKKNSVYYWSVHDNKILREFEGHQSLITSISMSPVDDSSLSSSADRTVRLWNAGKSGNSLCELKLPQTVEGPPLAAFDSTGLVFGVTARMAGDEGNVSSFATLCFVFHCMVFIFFMKMYSIHTSYNIISLHTTTTTNNDNKNSTSIYLTPEITVSDHSQLWK